MRKGNKGFTLIELLIVIAVIAILAALAIPNLISSRKAANETNAVSMMRSIITAQESYKSRGLNTDPDEQGFYATLSDLEDKDLISWPADGTYEKSGYEFVDASDGPSATAWGAVAVPMTANDGDRDFGATNDGFVRYISTAGETDLAIAAIQAWTVLQ